jgi:hypothetical protein
MLNDWRTRPVGTIGRRRSATGATIVPGWSLLAAPPAIIVTEILRTIPAGTTTVTGAANLIEAIAATSVTIATNQITATIRTESREIEGT